MALIDKLLIDGEALDADVTANLTPSSELLLSMDGASTLTLAIDDPDRDILESGVLARTRRGTVPRGLETAAWERLGKVQLSVEGTFWRLAGVTLSGPVVSLSFEQEIVARLRAHTRFVRLSRRYTNNGKTRGISSRAGAIAFAVSQVKHPSVPARIFEGSSKIQDDDPEKDKKTANKGIPSDAKIEIKGITADADQIGEINTALGVAEGLHASKKAKQGLVVAGIGESAFRPVPNSEGSPYGGVFQGKVRGDQSGPAQFTLEQTDRMAHYFLTGGKGYQSGGALKLARENPGITPGTIATRVEASGQPSSFYDKYRHEADEILDAYGSGDPSAPQQIRGQYTFDIGTPKNADDNEKEDYFESCLRLARDVNTYFFATTQISGAPSGDTFVYATGPQLLKSVPAYTLVERWERSDPPGTFEVGQFESGEWHYNKPAGDLTFRAPLPDRWFAAPGLVARVLRMGPWTGRWLTQEIRLPLDALDAEFTLIRPSPPKPEPQSTKTVPREHVGDTSGTKVSNAIAGSPIPGQQPHAPDHQTSGLPGYPAFDYLAKPGTPVVAPATGTVFKLSGRDPKEGGTPHGPLGYSIYISGTNSKKYFLTHLDKVIVKLNEDVTQGEQIAEVAAGPPSWSVPHCHMGTNG